MLEARELPRCSLSDYLETQLRACVEEDTRLRAQKLGRPENEVRHFAFTIASLCEDLSRIFTYQIFFLRKQRFPSPIVQSQMR